MSTIGYLRKKASRDIASSPWGVQYTPRDYPHDLLLDHMGKSGVKWTRLAVSWPTVEVEKGRYDWSLVDKLVDGLIGRGINVFLGTGSGSHPAYQDFPAGELWPPTHVPEALDAYCRYGAAMVEHFRDRVRHYEIWNEPNISIFWRPEPDPKAYALMVRRMSAAMRDVDNGIRVIGGVLAGAGRPESNAVEYTRSFMSEPGTAEAMDILTYHPYNAVPEDTVPIITAIREAAHAIRPDVPLWQGECGCPSSGDTIHARPPEPWGYNIQAKWLLRRLLTDYMLGAEISVYFLIVEFFGHLRPGSPELRTGYNTKGLIQHTTWATKPAYYTLQNLTATIDSSWQRVDERAEIEIVEPGIFFGIGPHEDRYPCVPWQLTLKRGDVPMLAYWLPWRPQEIVKPAKVRIRWRGVSWREPVCVDLLNGEVSEAKWGGGALEVPMADYPMLLTERSVLDLADIPQQPGYEELLSKLRWTY